MSEVETTTNETPRVSMGDVLKPETQGTEISVQQAPEVKTEAPVETTQVTAPETTAEAPVTEPPVQTEETEADKKVSGVLKGLTAERKRRQAAEARLAELESQSLLTQQPLYDTQTTAPEATLDKNEARIISISESFARNAHPDYQEKLDAFMDVIGSGPHFNRALYDSVMESDNPGEAAYIAGKTVLMQKKYGVDLETQHQNIRKELEAELKPKIRAELEAELTGKVQNRLNQPTNILAGRSANGAYTPEFRPTSFGELVSKKRTR